MFNLSRPADDTPVEAFISDAEVLRDLSNEKSAVEEPYVPKAKARSWCCCGRSSGAGNRCSCSGDVKSSLKRVLTAPLRSFWPLPDDDKQFWVEKAIRVRRVLRIGTTLLIEAFAVTWFVWMFSMREVTSAVQLPVDTPLHFEITRCQLRILLIDSTSPSSSWPFFEGSTAARLHWNKRCAVSSIPFQRNH
jgi:hypothetical protein